MRPDYPYKQSGDRPCLYATIDEDVKNLIDA